MVFAFMTEGLDVHYRVCNASSGVASGGSLSPRRMERDKIGMKMRRNGIKRTSRKDGGYKKMRGRQKHEDVNGKMLGKDVKHSIHRTTNYDRSRQYETCDTKT